MIAVQSVVDRMISTLDAEGSDRYLFDQDLKPAINSAVEWLVAVFNAAFADKKLTEEDLSELIIVKVFQASQYSRIHFDPAVVGEERWSILRVSPKPVVYPDIQPTALSSPVESAFVPDVSFIKSKHSAKRLTMEKWDENEENIFEAGNTGLNNQFRSYAYLNDADYRSNGYAVGGAEIEIRPEVPGEFVGISYIKYPEEIQLVTDDILFPKSLTTLLVQKALNFVSFKQGDQTNLFTVTGNDVAQLVQIMT